MSISTVTPSPSLPQLHHSTQRITASLCRKGKMTWSFRAKNAVCSLASAILPLYRSKIKWSCS